MHLEFSAKRCLHHIFSHSFILWYMHLCKQSFFILIDGWVNIIYRFFPNSSSRGLNSWSTGLDRWTIHKIDALERWTTSQHSSRHRPLPGTIEMRRQYNKHSQRKRSYRRFPKRPESTTSLKVTLTAWRPVSARAPSSRSFLTVHASGRTLHRNKIVDMHRRGSWRVGRSWSKWVVSSWLARHHWRNAGPHWSDKRLFHFFRDRLRSMVLWKKERHFLFDDSWQELLEFGAKTQLGRSAHFRNVNQIDLDQRVVFDYSTVAFIVVQICGRVEHRRRICGLVVW